VVACLPFTRATTTHLYLRVVDTATDHEDLATRLDRVESELAIRRLVYEYCHGADKRDLDRFAAIWDDEAVWAPDLDHPFVGIDTICAAVTGQWEAFRQMHHLTANLVVSIDGDRATGEADVDVCVQMPDGTWMRGGGTYRDVYVRRDGRWRIAYRDASPGYNIDPLPPGVGPPAEESLWTGGQQPTRP
jgi:ketosteroid isomerase-like protein